MSASSSLTSTHYYVTDCRTVCGQVVRERVEVPPSQVKAYLRWCRMRGVRPCTENGSNKGAR